MNICDLNKFRPQPQNVIFQQVYVHNLGDEFWLTLGMSELIDFSESVLNRTDGMNIGNFIKKKFKKNITYLIQFNGAQYTHMKQL